MEFPIEELEAMFKVATPVIRVVSLLIEKFEDSGSSNEDRTDEKACIKKAILMLKDETQAKKSFHIEKFVENTIENPECELENSTIFFLLKDIEQMTWRQFCLLEGFRRKDRNDGIKISAYSASDINGYSMETEIKILIDLNYLRRGSDSIHGYMSTSFDHIYISELGAEISRLLDLPSVELSEIGKAFGKGRIQGTVRY